MLDQLPKEIFLHIVSFLDAKYVISILSQVNHYFANIISDPSTFKIRIKNRWPGKYPPLPLSYEEESLLDWRSICISREEQNRLWTHGEDYQRIKGKTAQGISVDTVLVYNENTVISGSRDRSMALWNLSNCQQDNDNNDDNDQENDHQSYSDFIKPKQAISGAHTGWVWSLSANKNTPKIYSGSWDCSVKAWDLSSSGLKEEANLKCDTAVLCTALHMNDILVAGTFDKKVVLFDPKTNKRIGKTNYHKKPVLALNVDEDYIISISEDQTVVFFDRKAKKRIATIRLESSFPMCLYRRDNNTLYIGDKLGGLHIIDVRNFTIAKSYLETHKNKITGVHAGEGSIITCSTDGSIKVSQSDLNLDLISNLNLPEYDEITGLSYKNGLLTTGHLGCIQVWKPKN